MSPDPEAFTTPAAPITLSAAAMRMRNSRARRREGLRCVTIEVRSTEIDLLIRWGLLKAEARHDSRAVSGALHAYLDRTLSKGV